ncbi:MAG TPA: hypothetical protein VHT70_01755 [Candidatus Saccharimonadales bacterium]|jgi:hypothetical protein|nr:hypothetical protein [Candidatus Saccharimonadales bacterium]
MSRISFWKIFQVNPDGTIQPIVRVSLGGFILEPGQKIQQGVTFSGFDLFQYTGRDLEVQKKDGTEVITGVY